ncbi:hypothetical protein C4580_00540 [Candidatus Woesearchaeota archaeon]|nr:MAG: hypothetical protein C4580_00540 [Candidatus Woesearchaeota archaeon]
MKYALLTLFAVIAVSSLALGILFVEPTGNAVLTEYGAMVYDGQYAPAQYGYFTVPKRCMYQVPCRMRDDSCPSGDAVFADGYRVGCSLGLSTPRCGHYLIGWNGGQDCSYFDPNVQTQCVCP